MEDFIPPFGNGKNPYKLWSLSIYFNTVYVANYLYIIFILIANEFWEDLLGTNVLNTCYKDTVKYWLLLHFIKPIATMIIVKFCGLHKLFCGACSKLCLISFFMLMFDISFGVLAIYFCWLDLFNIYSQGNKNCNLPSPIEQYYNYDESSLIFILLSFLAIHFLFIWLELFRFVEVVTFQHNKRKLKKKKNKANKKKKRKNIENIQVQHNKDYQSVEMEDISKSIECIDDIDNDDNKSMERELSVSLEIANEGIKDWIS
eukprot:UN05811